MAHALTPPPTVGQLHRPPGWVRLYCTRYHPLCQHSAPMAVAPLIIRWGPDASSDVLRQCALHRVRAQRGDLAVSRMEERPCRMGAVSGRGLSVIVTSQVACYRHPPEGLG
jgi:hypothetical protein